MTLSLISHGTTPLYLFVLLEKKKKNSNKVPKIGSKNIELSRKRGKKHILGELKANIQENAVIEKSREKKKKNFNSASVYYFYFLFLMIVIISFLKLLGKK